MTGYQVCRRCIIDTGVAGAKFDASGECSYCEVHDKLERLYPLGRTGEKRLDGLVGKIKAAGRRKRFDCVVGVSGGRDSIYTLWLVHRLGLRPLAVYFNDGFGNPVSAENIKKASELLGIPLRTVTSDWRESRDIKIAFLKASTVDVEEGTDIGIETALYGEAVRQGVKYIISGYSFRTEGISPLEWNYLDGAYLRNVHRQFGSVKLRPWKPDDPGFNLSIPHIFYYTFIKGIVAVPILNYVNYVRRDAQEVITKELGWVYPGAKYYDDLYQSLMTYIFRVKFKIDRRRFIYSALIRSGQMRRDDALEEVKRADSIEDPGVIKLCVKRLGLSRAEFEALIARPPKTFRDFSTSYNYIRMLRPAIKILSRLNILPGITYEKYFECG